MTISHTLNLGLVKPDFDHRNWHLDLNTTIDLLEESISGIFVKAITGPDTLLITDGVSTDGRHALVEFTGAVTPSPIITVPNVEKLWLFLNSTDRALIISNGSGATVTVGVNTYSLVYNNSTDVKKVLEISALAAELGIVATILSDKVFKEHFDAFDISLWTQFQSLSGTTAVVTADDAANRKSVYGGSFLRLTQRAGYYFKQLPFNPDATYKVSGRLRQHSNGASTHLVYLGLVGFAADGITFVDTAGGTLQHPDNQHMAAVRQFELDSDIPGTWAYFEGYIKGSAVTGDAGPNNDVNAPGVIHENVRYVSPAFVVNWDSIDAICDIDSIELEIMDDRNVVNGVLSFAEGGKADASGLGSAFAQVGLEQNTQSMTADITLLDDPKVALGRAIQLLDPTADWNLDLPVVLTQPVSYLIHHDGTASTIKIRANALDVGEVNLLSPGEWIWIMSTSLTPTARSDWRCIARSNQQRTFTVGAGSWIVPQGVSSALASLAGAGGGGGASNRPAEAGGGGGGAFRENVPLLVVPGSSVAFTVGAKGVGGISINAPGTAGTGSTIGGVTASGGAGGAGGAGTGGAGGNTGFADAGGKGGDNERAGGNGPYAAGGTSGATQQGGGGGGGKDAGAAGGVIFTPGGDASGVGGGGGGGGGSGVFEIGGDGADGLIILRF